MNGTKLHFPPHTDGVHVWVATASPLIERCSRGSCKVIRHSRNGTWVEVTKPVRQKATKATEAQQPGFWT